MPAFTIRAIREQDNQVLANIIRSIFKEYEADTAGTVYEDPTTDNLYNLFNRQDAICWVAALNNVVAGCAGIYPTPGLPPGCCEFVKFYLAPQWRGKGLGSQLLKKCTDSAAAKGYNTIYLESLPVFDSAIRLYERAGFRPLPAPMGNSGHFGCNIWMMKDLTAYII